MTLCSPSDPALIVIKQDSKLSKIPSSIVTSLKAPNVNLLFGNTAPVIPNNEKLPKWFQLNMTMVDQISRALTTCNLFRKWWPQICDFMATRIKGKWQVSFLNVGNLSEKWDLEEQSRLLKFLAILKLWSLESEPVLWKSPALTSSLRVKSTFRAAPQITAKLPPNAPQTQEIATTHVALFSEGFQRISRSLALPATKPG